MTRNIFALSLLFLCLSLAAQSNSYRMVGGVGVRGISADAISQAPSATLGIEKVTIWGSRTDLFFGAGLEYGSFTAGSGLQPCNFPLGDKIVTFSFSESYDTRPLDLQLSAGIDYHLGNFRLRASLLPTLRLHDQISASSFVGFDNQFRPSLALAASVNPGEQFSWTDGTERELRYNSPVQLQGALEVGVQLSDGLDIGLGYRHGLTKYELQNYVVGFSDPPGPIGVGFRPSFEEFQDSSTKVATGTGYLMMRFGL